MVLTILLMHVRTIAGLTWSKYLIMGVHLFWYCQKKTMKILSINKTNYTKMQTKSNLFVIFKTVDHKNYQFRNFSLHIKYPQLMVMLLSLIARRRLEEHDDRTQRHSTIGNLQPWLSVLLFFVCFVSVPGPLPFLSEYFT